MACPTDRAASREDIGAYACAWTLQTDCPLDMQVCAGCICAEAIDSLGHCLVNQQVPFGFAQGRQRSPLPCLPCCSGKGGAVQATRWSVACNRDS